MEDNLLNYLTVVVLYDIATLRLYLIHSKEIRIDIFCSLRLVVSVKERREVRKVCELSVPIM